ncbi:MAG: aminodeoxychorismate synthase component I [Anaeromicrobium sp.]|jgi:para-aminobenzoate synthetase component 1|uniref:aminodeoxychorismate synthase component I n=1 Tax=Anaeromicrobium sp. TaxID=1929132 RepID=UPI0025F16620|nr:aminodeoxychorismate synthase component I [Anaeromicrobium sp.]MCT4593783.1 aminodeoxychorismate synthase component I [Anaeromicrobium sp.]
MKIKKIHTKYNGFELYTLFENYAYSFILDSGMDRERLGKYSFIGFDPFLVFKSKNGTITIEEGNTIRVLKGDPFHELKEIMKKYEFKYDSPLPFIGGAVGYFSYDLCHHVEKLPRTAIDDVNIYDCHFGLYDGIIVVDHTEDETYICSLGIKDDENKVIEFIENIINKKPLPSVEEENKGEVTIESNFTKENYVKAIESIKDYIKNGDIYQANMTQRFTANMTQSPLSLYSKLRKINPAPFAAFINLKDHHILSSSPERFIQIRDNHVETRPIKGTRPRGKSPEEDRLNREDLLSSEKDKSELLMIVDLERNDLGRVCKWGSVSVPELFTLETYPTVYHLVSTVVGELRDEIHPIDCIKYSFPGGSITGAPKIRAMEVIDELEPTGRNLYTGSIGYIGFNGHIDTNIVIRTILCKNNRAYFQAGGGIVWDSNAHLEYEESLHKAKALMNALKL